MPTSISHPVTFEAEIRLLALALPDTYERPHRRKPTFWVHERIFCMLQPGEAYVTVKLERDDQLNMIEGHPLALTPARLYSHHGWTYLYPERAGPGGAGAAGGVAAPRTETAGEGLRGLMATPDDIRRLALALPEAAEADH